MIVPIRLLSHKVVAVAPLKIVHQDPGNEAQEIGDEDGKFTSEASMSCTMIVGMNTQW